MNSDALESELFPTVGIRSVCSFIIFQFMRRFTNVEITLNNLHKAGSGNIFPISVDPRRMETEFHINLMLKTFLNIVYLA